MRPDEATELRPLPAGLTRHQGERVDRARQCGEAVTFHWLGGDAHTVDEHGEVTHGR